MFVEPTVTEADCLAEARSWVVRPPFRRLRHKAVPLQVGLFARRLCRGRSLGYSDSSIRGQRTAKVVCPRPHGLCVGPSEDCPSRHTSQTLPDSVMVAPQFLVLLVQVRILVG